MILIGLTPIVINGILSSGLCLQNLEISESKCDDHYQWRHWWWPWRCDDDNDDDDDHDDFIPGMTSMRYVIKIHTTGNYNLTF